MHGKEGSNTAAKSEIKPSHLKFCLSVNALHACVTLYLRPAAQLF